MSPRRRESAPGPTSTARLADDLRRRILVGDLAADAPLREEDLATSTGMSRHTVRAAIARLADERLVVLEPYRGARVTRFAADDVVALQQLRTALEGEAVRLLRLAHGDRWPHDVLAPARSALAALAEWADREDDWPGVAAAHAQVHTALVEAAGSPRLAEAHARLHSEMLLVLVHVRPHYRVATLVAEHTDYLEQVQREGEAAVRRHLERSTRSILEAG